MAWRLIRLSASIAIVGFLCGEFWFRLPWTAKLVVWDYDEERLARLAPNQSRSMGLGNFSVLSPPITINSDGYRNSPIDWTRPAILTLGSSEVLGPGVFDHEVWSSRLNARLAERLGKALTVVNGGSGGYGPYHQLVTFRRYLEQHPKPVLIIARVSIGDRHFRRPTPEELVAAKRRNEITRTVKRFTEFLPFLINKVQAQKLAIANAVHPGDERNENAVPLEQAEVGDNLWRTHSAYWTETVGLAERYQVPVLLFVDGPFAQPSELRVYELLRDALGSRPGVRIVLLGPEQLALNGQTLAQKRADFARRYTLGYDPHSNAARHEAIARHLADIILEPRFEGLWAGAL